MTSQHMTSQRMTSQHMTSLTPEERHLVRLHVDGPIAVITNNRPEKHNAMSDEMDRRLWEVLAELRDMPELRAIVWRGEGKSFSSGRDTPGRSVCAPRTSPTSSSSSGATGPPRCS